MKKYKIKIKSAPKMTYGGQSNYSLDTTPDWKRSASSDGEGMNNTLQPVDPSLATIEAELGETIIGDFDQDGMMEHMKVGGKRHSQGGSPIAAPSGSFVFSDTKKMSITGDVLNMFGKNPDKKFTPAQIAKQYDLNKYKSILDDKNADPIAKKTAQMMLDNNQKKLGQLALVQESKKGFPSGIPDIAQAALPQAALGGFFQAGGPLGLVGSGYVPGTTMAGTPGWTTADMFRDPFTITENGINPALLKDRIGTTIPVIPEQPVQNNFTIPRPDANQEMTELERQFPITKSPAPAATPSFLNNYGASAGNRTVNPSIPQPGSFNPTSATTNGGWMNNDKLALLNSAMDYGSIKKYSPYMAPVAPIQTADPVYYNPMGEIAANQGAANIQSQMAALYAGPQRNRAVGSAIQGQLAEANASTFGRYNNLNVGVANQAAQQRTDAINQGNFINSERMNKLYDSNVVANQQYDNALRQARTNMMQSVITGNQNATNLDNLNQLHEDYEADRSGRIRFKDKKARDNYFKKDQSAGLVDHMAVGYESLIKRGFSPETALKLMALSYNKNFKDINSELNP